MKDPIEYKLYKEKVNELLYSNDLKENLTFMDFLRMSLPSIMDNLIELESYYKTSNTFHDFFQSIPKGDRMRLVSDWIDNFMAYHLRDVFSDKKWIIEIPVTSIHDDSIFQENKTNEDVINEKKEGKEYYCPNERIYFYPIYGGLILGPEDI